MASASACIPEARREYADLVGLFPDRIVKDLGLELQLRSRRTSTYAPAGCQVRRRSTTAPALTSAATMSVSGTEM